jgi:hypothetical protein
LTHMILTIFTILTSILIRLPSLVRMVGIAGMVCSKVSEHIAS